MLGYQAWELESLMLIEVPRKSPRDLLHGAFGSIETRNLHFNILL